MAPDIAPDKASEPAMLLPVLSGRGDMAADELLSGKKLPAVPEEEPEPD